MTATMMRAVEVTTPGGPEVLLETSRPAPSPKSGELLIRVVGAGVNRPDVLQRLGLYPPPPGASDLPGLEVSGTIEAVGEDVARWRVGDEVCALLPGGGYAAFAVAHAGACLPIPKGVKLLEAAGLPETLFTVWANVFEDGDLQAGERLLVHGGTSGIGATAIRLAAALGAEVIATASSDKKLEAIRALGASHALRYDAPDWPEKVSALGGADVVLDMAGGDFVAKNLSALKNGGRHVSIAFLRGPEATINIMDVMRKRLRLSGSTMKARGHEEKARIARALEERVWPLFAAGGMAIDVDTVFPLTEASEAHRRMEAGLHVGKLILSLE
ncbi:MAG: NAD(P)H-quinone oxidoreductase [Pseudomonadota bacterium]